ncbi:metalloregulator ArsR/SmtB family transcription factor [Devosia sp. BK]|uniref:ArsR/SmtB family transcription factor n=1 Tax=Devosia sp. BK TaxID=2871706 RepID=UPI00293AD413|nr:metalloregulator ArsR/SmtB family transcription factor [Devosia sp. BK]MDV3251112.1 metalloregulator ArsR/SmtB family transcription factor [Devosia sp. BK]
MSKRSKPPIALYSALADTTRCRILEILKVAPTPVHVLTEAFSISRPAISRHLRVLKSAGLVAEVKKGRENVYAFRPAKLTAAKGWLDLIATAAEAETVEAEMEAVEVIIAKPAEAAKLKAAPAQLRKAKAKPIFKDEKQEEVSAAPAPSISQMGFDF